MKYQDLFQCLKGVGKIDLSDFSLPVPGGKYLLSPINCRLEESDRRIVEMLTASRNANTDRFLTFFDATPERTRDWLCNSVANDETRILFVLKEIETGALCGYMGLAYGDDRGERIEGDAIVKFASKTQPGFMRKAFTVLVEWASGCLGFKEVWVRVLSDNPAIAFYEKCHFIRVRDVQLYEVMNSQKVVQELTERSNEGLLPSSRRLTHMKYQPNECIPRRQ